jgi:hypothetical protein
LQGVDIPHVGRGVSAVHLIQAVTGKEKRMAQGMIGALVTNPSVWRARAETLLGRKMEIPGDFRDPTPVVTFREAQELLEMLSERQKQRSRSNGAAMPALAPGGDPEAFMQTLW